MVDPYAAMRWSVDPTPRWRLDLMKGTRGTVVSSSVLERILDLIKVDFSPTHRYPSKVRVLLGTLVSLGGSLAVDVALVALGTSLFPSTQGYSHFQFSDYAKLTIIGVFIACLSWPIVTRVTSAPRWLFFRLAIAVTLVLLLPDVYILKQGQPAKAVAVLMCMHVAIGLVTYNALVRVAPVRPRHGSASTPGLDASESSLA